MTVVSCHCEGATHVAIAHKIGNIFHVNAESLERPWQSQGSEAETCNSKTEANAKLLELNEITTSCAAHTPRNDMCHPEAIAEGSQEVNEMLKQVQDDKYVSEAHSKELNVLKSYRLNDFKKKAAFTLAEVLITLGIIGIVAAMTIPTLIANYQKKVLKTQFMKKYAEISQAVLLAKSETYGNFKAYCIKYDGTSFYREQECKEIFDKYFKEVGTCEYKDDVLTYDKKRAASVNYGAVEDPARLLSDGSCYDMKVNAYQLGFTFDMNGPDKGPNALGHDIFSFWVDDNDYLQPIKQSNIYSENDVETGIENCLTSGEDISTCTAIWHQRGFPCTMNSTQQGNGLGCSWFALHDECPDDDTKGYWECLP